MDQQHQQFNFLQCILTRLNNDPQKLSYHINGFTRSTWFHCVTEAFMLAGIRQKQTNRQTDRQQTNKQTDKHTNKQTDRQTSKQTHKLTYINQIKTK